MLPHNPAKKTKTKKKTLLRQYGAPELQSCFPCKLFPSKEFVLLITITQNLVLSNADPHSGDGSESHFVFQKLSVVCFSVKDDILLQLVNYKGGTTVTDSNLRMKDFLIGDSTGRKG